jgi:SecD/SecF fusion protein
MKEFRFRIILILAVIALCIYLLFPTYQDYRNNKEISEIIETERTFLIENTDLQRDQIENQLELMEDSIRAADPSIQKARQNRVKLGLDLQGGMRVVLEVNTIRLLDRIAKNPDATFTSILNEAERRSDETDEPVVDLIGSIMNERGIRLSRYFGNIRQDDSQILDELRRDTEDAVARAMEIIRNRVDQYGVSEPSIQRQGNRRIIVELPGVAKEEEAKQLLQGTALLEFRILREPDYTVSLMQRIDNVLAGKDLSDPADTLEQPLDTAADTTEQIEQDTLTAEAAPQEDRELTEEEFRREHPFFSIAMLNPQGSTAEAFVYEDQRDRLQRMLNRPEVRKVMPDNVEFVFSAKPAAVQEGKRLFLLYLVGREPLLTGGVITTANANLDPNTSAPIVNMEMNSEGATEWSRITGANIGKRIAIMMDGVVFSAPVVQNRIPGGRSQITGMESLEEAKLLEIVLKAGALPAPVDIIEERTVGPSLGQDSINSGFSAALIGYLFVGIFMMFYYQKSGSISAIALVITVLFILGVLAGFNATLTLPGIAGIILTIGMAVDANVLIFERIREEFRTGKTVKASIDSGFSKAYSAIIDSNITTFFTAIILYQFGTGPIQGFALTLMIGIAASLFSALVLVRLVFDYMVYKGAKISIG